MARAGLVIAIGVLGVLILTRLLESLLFGVSSTDPVTFAGVALALAGVALALAAVALGSCFIPARRATRIDPVRTLNAE